jgi:hypothetical protein
MTIRKLLDWRKALIYTHRWIGIILTTVFMIWFVSGVIFMYVGMPALSAEERLQRMQPLVLANLRVTPADAAGRAGLTSPSRVRIAMHAGRPAYRFQSDEGWTLVYADTGERLEGMSADEAMAELRRFLPESAGTLRHERRLTDSDQWTLQSVIRTNMPMHRIAVDDGAGTEYYVSERTGEPVLRTTASGRFWGYLSAVLHWLYFTPLRRQTEFWNSFVVWSSLIGTVMCGMGIAIGIWRYSLAGRFRLRGATSHTPYAGWMKWHHYSGLVFGLFACTWAFSGALSLSPFDFLRGSPTTRAFREAATGGPIDLAPLMVERIRAVVHTVHQSFTAKELDFFQFLGEPYFIAYAPPTSSEAAPWRNDGVASATALHIDRRFVLVSALRPEAGSFMTFEKDRMWDVAKAAMPGIPIADTAWLNEYDAYYYSHDNERRLPVLRIRYSDPQATWLYLDPERGTIASRLERGSRWNRWLYHGFHSLDFPFLYYRRPLWDIVVIVLSIGGIAMSVTSALPAWRRLVRHGRTVGGRLLHGTRGRLTGSSLSRPPDVAGQNAELRRVSDHRREA